MFDACLLYTSYAAEFEDLDIKENTKEAAVKISALKFAQLLEEKM